MCPCFMNCAHDYCHMQETNPASHPPPTLLSTNFFHSCLFTHLFLCILFSFFCPVRPTLPQACFFPKIPSFSVLWSTLSRKENATCRAGFWGRFWTGSPHRKKGKSFFSGARKKVSLWRHPNLSRWNKSCILLPGFHRKSWIVLEQWGLPWRWNGKEHDLKGKVHSHFALVHTFSRKVLGNDFDSSGFSGPNRAVQPRCAMRFESHTPKSLAMRKMFIVSDAKTHSFDQIWNHRTMPGKKLAKILRCWLAMRKIEVFLRSSAVCLQFGLPLWFGLRCEHPRCQIASDVGRAMRATKVRVLFPVRSLRHLDSVLWFRRFSLDADTCRPRGTLHWHVWQAYCLAEHVILIIVFQIFLKLKMQQHCLDQNLCRPQANKVCSHHQAVSKTFFLWTKPWKPWGNEHGNTTKQKSLQTKFAKNVEKKKNMKTMAPNPISQTCVPKIVMVRKVIGIKTNIHLLNKRTKTKNIECKQKYGVQISFSRCWLWILRENVWSHVSPKKRKFSICRLPPKKSSHQQRIFILIISRYDGRERTKNNDVLIIMFFRVIITANVSRNLFLSWYIHCTRKNI